jgi:hypothetical protein
VFNINNFTSENNPGVRPLQATGPAIDTWTRASVQIDTGSFTPRIIKLLRLAVGVLADCFAGGPRRLCDQLFAVNDAEANWRGWEVINAYGGLGRRYRDPRFDMLDACPKCQGTGIDTDEPCDFCLGTGRLSSAGDDDAGEVS